MTLKNGLGKCSLFVLSANGWKDQRHGLFVFPPKKTLIWRRHCSIGQSCSSMTSKRSIGWFLESSLAWSFFSPECSLIQPKATRVCVRSINQSNSSISVRLLFLFCSRVFISRSHENLSIKHETQCFITRWNTEKRVEKQDAQRSIFDEFRGVSSGAETLCRMLDIASQTKWF